MTKLTNSNYDKTKKNQIVTKLKSSNGDTWTNNEMFSDVLAMFLVKNPSFKNNIYVIYLNLLYTIISPAFKTVSILPLGTTNKSYE